MTDRILQQISGAEALTETERQAFTVITSPRRLRKHELLLREGDVCRAITFVLSGCLRSFYSVSGVENTTQFFCENAWYTDYPSFLTGQPTRENAQALEACEVVQLSRLDLEQLYRQHPVFERLSRILAENAFVCLEVRNTMLTNQTPEDRYRQLAHDRPELLQRVPQYHIASFLGIQPETLSRIRKRIVSRV